MFCFALMETWNSMKWLTLVLELCLSVVSMKNHLNCVKVEAIVYLQFLLKAALTAELCSWISGGCQINVCYFFIWLYSAVACRGVGSKEKMGARKIIKYVWHQHLGILSTSEDETLYWGCWRGGEKTFLSWHMTHFSQCRDEELPVCLALSTGKLEHFFVVGTLQESVLCCRGSSHGGGAFLNFLRGPREKAVCSVSDCTDCLFILLGRFDWWPVLFSFLLEDEFHHLFVLSGAHCRCLLCPKNKKHRRRTRTFPSNCLGAFAVPGSLPAPPTEWVVWGLNCLFCSCLQSKLAPSRKFIQ